MEIPDRVSFVSGQNSDEIVRSHEHLDVFLKHRTSAKTFILLSTSASYYY